MKQSLFKRKKAKDVLRSTRTVSEWLGYLGATL